MEQSQEKRSTTPDTVSTGGLRGFAARHPQLVAWAVLAVVMVVMVAWSARDVGLLPGQMAAIILATIGLAGLCVWIIGWD
ncbi:MAG: hypothetical protein ACOYEW_13760 [Anaerolineae bacterium]|jgi:hypothetical protein